MLSAKKAEDIVVLDMSKVSTITDYFVIATGGNGPHIKALLQETEKQMKEATGKHAYRTSGTPDSGWLVLDYVDVVIHLFSAQERKYYDLERLWGDAPWLA